MSSETFAVRGEQTLQDLASAAMHCLVQFNVPEMMIKAFSRVASDLSGLLIVRVVDLWNTGVPDFEINARSETTMASAETCEARWGDFFTFPYVRPGMTSEAIEMRCGLLHFAASVSKVQDASREIFCNAKVRAGMGPEIFKQVQTICMLFWILKIDKIYYATSEGWRVHVDENPAVLNVQYQETDEDEPSDDDNP